MDNYFVRIRKCLGNLAVNNLYDAHKNCKPGGWDVNFRGMTLNQTAPFETFKEAHGYAIMFVNQLKDKPLHNSLSSLREEDCYDSVYAYNLLESKIGQNKYPIEILGKTSFGWLFIRGPKKDKVYYVIGFDDYLASTGVNDDDSCVTCLARKEFELRANV